MSFARYAKYKDSGVEWLGEVPEHWEIRRARFLFEIRKRIAGALGYDVLSVTQSGIRIKDIDSNDGQLSMDYSKYQIVEPGDFAMNHMDLLTGYVDISSLKGVTSPDYRVFSVRTAAVTNAQYLLYILQMGYQQKIFFAYGQGSSQLGRWRLPTEQFNDLRLPLPARREQDAIAAFLDRETAKIDALIAEQEKLIALLKEKRQALISHAVTKGLDPNAQMKDSGIEWLGQVPAHWEVRAIKHIVATPVTDGPHETPEFLDEGVPFVSAEAVSDGNLNFEKIRGYISRDDHERYASKYRPRKGDVYMVKSGATTGVTAIVDTDDEFNIWSPLAAIRCDSEVHPRYLLHYMRSRNFLDAITLGWSFGTQQNIGMNVIENLAVPVPPTSEQDEIQVALDNAEALSESLIAEAARAITLLKEHRAALISAAVTGKIDVRGEAAKAAA